MRVGGRRETYLQDSFTDKMDAPRLPITRPIFPGGTSRAERISSSGAVSSMMRLSIRRKHSYISIQLRRKAPYTFLNKVHPE